MTCYKESAQPPLPHRPHLGNLVLQQQCKLPPRHSRYDPDRPVFYGNHRAYADKFPDSWKANTFREGKYPDPSSFISGHLDPDCPKPQPSYARAASSSASKGNKKNKNSTTATKVAAVVNSVPALQRRKPLPTAERRFYPPRSPTTEHPEALLIAATFPEIAARLLRDANCTLPLAVTAKINDRGSVTLLVSDPTTPAAAFASYFEALTTQFNNSFPIGNSPLLPFRLALNEEQLAIHSLPIPFLLDQAGDLVSSHADIIFYSKNVQIVSARFLNPNPESRASK